MKLIIQIPCLNEAETLPLTLADLPRRVAGFDEVEWLIVDDGSTDRTIDVARAGGVDHIVSLHTQKGLATAFQAGLDAALKLGADVVVNTDADNQYKAEDIPSLVEPILEREADMVVGVRSIRDHDEFSRSKKLLQRVGSWVVQRASRTRVPDATSGFRAYTREAALRLNVVSRFSYTLETVIQAGKSDLRVAYVSIRTNPKTRESRLFTSTLDYIKKQMTTILRIYAMYEPLTLFLLLSLSFGLVGGVLVLRFLWLYFTESGPTGHVQSVVIGAGALVMSVLFLVLGVLADLIRMSRIISERALQRIRQIELSLSIPPDHLVEPPLVRERLKDPEPSHEAPEAPTPAR
jgi:glycosyltransferase involved in cell wall biosynthesis